MMASSAPIVLMAWCLFRLEMEAETNHAKNSLLEHILLRIDLTEGIRKKSMC